jgi:hypothetical protein
MDLSKVVLINFIDKVRINDSDPSITVQRLVRYSPETAKKFNYPSIGEGEKASDCTSKVLSLTRRHWNIYDKLTEELDVCPSVLFGAVERYQKVKPCGFDQAFEICLDMIWRTFDLDDSAAQADDEEKLVISDGDIISSSTIH